MSTTIGRVTHLPAGTGSAFGLMGSSVTFKDDPEATEGALMLFEHMMPESLGVPPHTEGNHEAFYVLEGTLDVEADGTRYRLRPGDFLGIAPGVVHSLHNPGPGRMRVLTLVSPGSRHRRFFSTLGLPIDDAANPPGPETSPDVETVLAVGRECGIAFLPPPEA